MSHEQVMEQLIISQQKLRQYFGKGTKITEREFNKWNKNHVIHNTMYTLVRYKVIIMTKNIFGDYEYFVA